MSKKSRNAKIGYNLLLTFQGDLCLISRGNRSAILCVETNVLFDTFSKLIKTYSSFKTAFTFKILVLSNYCDRHLN